VFGAAFAHLDVTNTSMLGAHVYVGKLEKSGVVIRHDPDDLELTFKIRFGDSFEDWFPHTDVELAPQEESAEKDAEPGSVADERALRVWFGGLAACHLGLQASSDGTSYAAYDDRQGPVISTLYDMDLQSILGEGAFAITVPASFASRSCCVKIMKKEHVGEEYRKKIVHMFGMCLRMCKQLGHPNIVEYLDFLETPLHYMCVMERLGGEELFDSFLRQFPITENHIKDIMRQILAALRIIHEVGFVHRDLKLENFRYASSDSSPVLKLLDFGMVRRAGDVWEDKISGTLLYLAPEIVANVPPEKHEGFLTASDMWAVGVIFYILLAGKEPFGERAVWDLGRDDASSIISKVLSGPRLSDASIEARDFLGRLFAQDPRSRITAAEALRHPWLAGDDASPVNVSKEEYSLIRRASTKSIKFVDEPLKSASEVSRGQQASSRKRVINVPACPGPTMEKQFSTDI
jgi:serine/threonine protein kinase